MPCRTVILLSDCRTVGLSDCHFTCRTVGLSDCQTVRHLSDICRRTVGTRAGSARAQGARVPEEDAQQHQEDAPHLLRCVRLEAVRGVRGHSRHKRPAVVGVERPRAEVHETRAERRWLLCGVREREERESSSPSLVGPSCAALHMQQQFHSKCVSVSVSVYTLPSFLGVSVVWALTLGYIPGAT